MTNNRTQVCVSISVFSTLSILHLVKRIGDSTEADTLMVCKSVQMYGNDILYSVESREVTILLTFQSTQY